MELEVPPTPVIVEHAEEGSIGADYNAYAEELAALWVRSATAPARDYRPTTEVEAELPAWEDLFAPLVEEVAALEADGVDVTAPTEG